MAAGLVGKESVEGARRKVQKGTPGVGPGTVTGDEPFALEGPEAVVGDKVRAHAGHGCEVAGGGVARPAGQVPTTVSP